jgi:hypothetical protein
MSGFPRQAGKADENTDENTKKNIDANQRNPLNPRQ